MKMLGGASALLSENLKGILGYLGNAEKSQIDAYASPTANHHDEIFPDESRFPCSPSATDLDTTCLAWYLHIRPSMFT